MKHYLSLILLTVMVFCGCQEDEPVFVASADFKGVSINARATSADIQWQITSKASIDKVSLECAKDSSFANSKYAEMTLNTSSKYQVTLTSLSANTRYYVRCKVFNKYSTYLLPDVRTFTTKPYSAPTVTTSAPSNISAISATCGGNVTDDGGHTITERGICYSTTSNPTTSNSKVTSMGNMGSFTCSLTGLTANTKYYIRAYATNSKGTSYGGEMSFTTQDPSNAVILYAASSKLPEVTSTFSDGLHTNAFGVSIVSHEFSDGIGTIRFSNSVTSIGEYAFYNCDDLTSIAIPNSVTSIGGHAFYSCDGLTSITIPKSVTNIGIQAFGGCNVLISINVASENNKYSSSDGVLFNYDKTKLVAYPYGKSGSYSIPNSVTIIGDYAFCSCDGLTSITIPNSVTSIGVSAFAYCSKFTSITIPNSVTSIGSEAFAWCSGLTSITIPNSVTSIGSEAFAWCRKLTSITVSSGNSKYSSSNGVLFNYAKTTLITYPGGKSGSYSIPNSVTSIGEYAFAGCDKMTSITIPNSVKTIAKWAFFSCDGLTSITIPNSVTSIGGYAFTYCQALTSITSKATTPPTCDGSNVFDEVTKSIPVYVPASSVSAYKAADGWKEFTNIQAY